MVLVLLGFECANADTPVENLILGREANGVKRGADCEAGRRFA
jgi:hypothetical protein